MQRTLSCCAAHRHTDSDAHTDTPPLPHEMALCTRQRACCSEPPSALDPHCGTLPVAACRAVPVLWISLVTPPPHPSPHTHDVGMRPYSAVVQVWARRS
jgi:hypothetical protein